MNNTTVLHNQGSTVYLNSAMTPQAFSKARQGIRIAEKGVLAVKENNSWTFAQWTFTETVASSEILPLQSETVFLSGTFAAFSSLKDSFDMETQDDSIFQKAKTVQAAALAVSAIQEALKTGKKLPLNGAGGILVSKDNTQILFLPEDLYNTAVSCFGDETYSQEKGFYVNENLKGTQALKYIQAAICYRTLSGNLPFTNATTKARNEDQLDRNFLPLKHSVWALNQKLADHIDLTLSEKANSSNNSLIKLPEEELLPLDLFYREIGLTENGLLQSDGTLLPVIRKSNRSQEQFQEKSARWQEVFHKKLSVKRHIRHNSTKYIIGIAAVVLVAGFTAVRYRDNQKKPSTLGLTSVETLEMYYSALNRLDIVQAQETVKGKNPTRQIDIMSNYYVATRTQATYENSAQTISLAEWLNFNNDCKYGIFGISQLYIDGAKSPIFYLAPERKDHGPIVTEENGNILSDGDTITHNVQYILATDMAEDNLEIQTHNDTVTLTYKKNAWYITDFQQNTDFFSVNINEFHEDYKKCYTATNGNNLEYSGFLSEKYNWIPTTSEILEAHNFMKEHW